MIKKIVTLAVGFVFAFVAIFFSVRAEGVAEGKGNGKDATVKDPEEFAEVLETLPDADYYEGILAEEQLKNSGKAGKSLSAPMNDDDDSVRPVTLYEKSLLSQTGRSYSHSDGRINDSKSYNYLRRTMYIYYTKDAVYYDSVGQTITKTVREYGPDDEYTRTTEETVLDFDAHMYIGKSGAYIKFNKWETTQTKITGTVKNNTFIEDVEDDENINSNANAAMEEVQKALQKHYGQWISIYGGELSEIPGLDDIEEMPNFGGEDAMLTYMAKMVCAEAAEAYYEQLVDTTANNSTTFKKFAGYFKSYYEPLAFEKSGNIYKMTDLAKQALLAEYGWIDLSTGSYSNHAPVDGCYFVIDMNNKKAPAFLTNINYSLSADGGSASYTLRDELGIKHLDNTVVPYTPTTKDDMYTLFGDAVKKIIKSLMSENTLLIDGLNAATEVIG